MDSGVDIEKTIEQKLCSDAAIASLPLESRQKKKGKKLCLEV